MGTVFSFDIRHPGVSPDALTDAVALLHALDAQFSTYRDDSEVSHLARGELGPGELSADLRFVLAECDRWRQRTDGWFDARAGGTLDPSGYVKGWAIQRVSDRLAEAGSTSHCVNGGGDVACVGSAGERPWRLGIVDPADRDRLLATVEGDDLALATSGTAERGAHILDPHTGAPVSTGLLSVSVTGPSVIDCDVYATAAFAMGSAAEGWLAARGIRSFGVRVDGSTWSSL